MKSMSGQPHDFRGLSRTAGELVFGACTIRDWKDTMEVFRVCFPEYPPAEMAWFLEQGSYGIRLLRDGDRIIGFSVLNPAHGAEVAWLEMIGVVPDVQGRGLGRRLLEDYETFVLRLGYPRIELAVNADNRAAVALYENSGYHVCSRRSRRLVYRKFLRPNASAPRPAFRHPGPLRRACLGLIRRVLVRV